MTATYTDKTLVLHGHLVEIYEALDAARGLAASLDLAQQYRKVTRDSQESELTTRLEIALGRVTGYLEGADDGISKE